MGLLIMTHRKKTDRTVSASRFFELLLFLLFVKAWPFQLFDRIWVPTSYRAFWHIWYISEETSIIRRNSDTAKSIRESDQDLMNRECEKASQGRSHGAYSWVSRARCMNAYIAYRRSSVGDPLWNWQYMNSQHTTWMFLCHSQKPQAEYAACGCPTWQGLKSPPWRRTQRVSPPRNPEKKGSDATICV